MIQILLHLKKNLRPSTVSAEAGFPVAIPVRLRCQGWGECDRQHDADQSCYEVSFHLSRSPTVIIARNDRSSQSPRTAACPRITLFAIEKEQALGHLTYGSEGYNVTWSWRRQFWKHDCCLR